MSQSNSIILICVVSALVTMLLMYFLFRADRSKKEVKPLSAGTEDAGVEFYAERPLITGMEEPAPREDSISIINQPDLSEINDSWKPLDAIEKVDNFEIYTPTVDIYKWRLLDIDGEPILTSNADYITDVTCKNGILSAVRSIKTSGDTSPFVIGVSKQTEYAFVLKAGNGKIIGLSPLYLSEALAEEAIDIVISRII